ncbi:MAG TPA: type II CAAX endopeptidase family protein [Chloroflexota bacterium]|nr:type II CAAX endopeptidase family protein [Chloroflexota bacterium]
MIVTPATQPRRSLLQLFVTAEGRLNLFWRLFLYLLGFFTILLICLVLRELLRQVVGVGELGSALLYAVMVVPAQASFTYLFRRHVDRRPWADFGLTPLRDHWQSLGLGFGLGVLMMGALFVVELSLGMLELSGTELIAAGLLPGLALLLLKLVGPLATGFIEELAFRGYVFQNLGGRFPIWVAALGAGVIFGLVHFGGPGVNAWFVLSTTVISVLLVITRLTTRTLWMAIGWHGAWNWAQYHLFGLAYVNVSDFGDAVFHVRQRGPELLVGQAPAIEGGLLTIAVELVGLVVFLAWPAARAIPWNARLSDEGQPAPG